MKKNGSRAVVRLVWPYALVILLFSLSISFILALKTATVLRDDTYALYARSLRTMADSMDSLFVEMDGIAYDVEQGNAFSPYLAFGSGYATSRITSAFKSYMKANAYLADIVLYYTPNVARIYASGARFFTGSGAMDEKLFFGIHPADALQNAPFSDFAAGVLRSGSLFPVTETTKTSTRRYFVYYAPIGAISNQINTRGVVLFFISRENLISALGGENAEEQGVLRAYSPEGKAIFYTGGGQDDADTLFSAPDMAARRAKESAFSLNGGDSVTFCLRTAARGNWYTLTLPAVRFPLFSDNIVSLFTPLLAAAVLSAFLMLYLLVRHFVKPIMQVTDIIDPARQGTIIENVAASLRSLQEQRSDLIYKIEMQTAFLDIQSLMMLLQGVPRDQAPAHLEEFMRRNEADQYLIVTGEILRAREGGALPMSADGVQKLIDSLPLPDDEKRCAVSLDTPGCFVALLCAPESENAPRLAQRLWEALRDAAPDTLSTLSRSEVFYSLMDASAAYLQARKTMDQKFILGTGGVLSPAREDRAPGRFMGYPVEQEEKLMRALEAGAYADVEKTARDIAGVLRRERPAQAVAKSLCVNLCNRALSLAGGDGCDMETTREGFLSLRESLTMPAATLDQFEERFLALCREMCLRAKAGRRSDTAALCERVNAYLEQNYINPLLSLNMIADAFEVSGGHLSRLFSERYNVSVMHRVDTLRMARATELLGQSDQKLSDIISACGYNDRSNFMRKFKNAYGITPMAYRNLRKNQSSAF